MKHKSPSPIQRSLFAEEQNPFWYFHRTSSDRLYPLEIGYKQLPSDQIPCDKLATTRECKEGCSLYGRNGGCPPYSPEFNHLQTLFPHAIAVYSRLYTKFYPPKVANGSFYVRWNFVKTFMERVILKVGKSLSKRCKGFLLGAGPCRACGNMLCAFKQGESQCRKPTERVFSVESTGVLATTLMPQLFSIPLLWFDANNHDHFPEYMVNVILILTKEQLAPETMDLYVHHSFDSMHSAYSPSTKEERSHIMSRDWRS